MESVTAFCLSIHQFVRISSSPEPLEVLKHEWYHVVTKEIFTLSGNLVETTVEIKTVRSPDGAGHGQMAKQFAVR